MTAPVLVRLIPWNPVGYNSENERVRNGYNNIRGRVRSGLNKKGWIIGHPRGVCERVRARALYTYTVYSIQYIYEYAQQTRTMAAFDRREKLVNRRVYGPGGWNAHRNHYEDSVMINKSRIDLCARACPSEWYVSVTRPDIVSGQFRFGRHLRLNRWRYECQGKWLPPRPRKIFFSEKYWTTGRFRHVH